ncbi:MAG: hypothetical protein LUE26_00295 [Alistipes sp.]|nr:hypothetical protein [Alistipes sp.]
MVWAAEQAVSTQRANGGIPGFTATEVEKSPGGNLRRVMDAVQQATG